VIDYLGFVPIVHMMSIIVSIECSTCCSRGAFHLCDIFTLHTYSNIFYVVATVLQPT
jgi:hypothetical protein